LDFPTLAEFSDLVCGKHFLHMALPSQSTQFPKVVKQEFHAATVAT
jgi:hypothetical protein